MEPLVSVIIPTYKGADKIGRAVESVLNQSYPHLEIIVVDDNGAGTPEQLATGANLAKYKDRGNVFYLVHEVNKNGSAARNTGIRKSNGDYLCFLDDDDVFLPDKTWIQVKKLQSVSDDYGMVFGAVDEVVSSDTVWHHPAAFEGDFLYQYLTGKLPACSSSVMITKQAMQTVKEWDESFKRHQDWEFFARVADAFKVTYVSETCVKKYKYDANLPKDGEVTEKYRMHFLEKMKPIIEKYEPKKVRRILDHHYVEVGKVYLKNKNIKGAMRMASKTKSKVKTFSTFICDGYNYLVKRR